MAFSLVQTLCELPLAFVDLETTGASADFGHKIIEVGIVRVEGGKNVAEYQQLVDPLRRISAGVTFLTGITQEMVDGKPTFAAQMPAMLQLFRGAIVLGHNVRFDLSFLRREFRRCGCEITQVLDNAPVLDTVRIARKRFGRGGNALQVLSRRLGIVPAVAHRALADAQTTHLVFEQLMSTVGGWGCMLCDAMQQQGGPMGLLPVSARESLLPLELEEALDARRPVMMEYVDGEGRRTERVVQPLHVRRRGGELHLVAHCELRGAQRTFKLDRVVHLTRIENAPAVTQSAAPVAEPVAVVTPVLDNTPVVP